MLNIIFCVTLRTLPTTLKGVNMELEIELYELDKLYEGLKFYIEWEFDPEYSPKEGLYNKFIWTAYLQVRSTHIDITDELSDAESRFIEKQLEESLDD